MSTIIRNQSVVDALDKIAIVELNIADDFPIPIRDGLFLDRNNRMAEEVERKTKGGIILPATAMKSSYTAIIVAVGPECPIYLRPGMMVMYNSAVQAEVEIDGCMYTPCSYYDILCVLPPRALMLDNDLDEGQKRREKSLERNAKVLGAKIVK